MSLLSATRAAIKEREQYAKDDLILCAHIRTALSTESGRILKAWLKRTCFMDVPMDYAQIESQAQTQMVSALRDLFIELENREQRGNHVTDS